MSDIVLLTPLPGWALPLEEVDDDVFAARMLGDGVAIDPTDGTLRAPCDGEVTVVPESAHAVSLRAAGGADLLLHVGIDTVALKGEGFEALVREGQRVSAGDPLLRFDLDRTVFGTYTPEKQWTLSQELRIASNPDQGSPVDYVAGLYYQHLDFTRAVTFQLGCRAMLR